MLQKLILVLFIFGYSNLQAQDCDHAIWLNMPVHSQNAPANFGKKLEIQGNKLGNLYYFEQEHHTVWYKFKANQDCKLTFEIVPEQITDDYDFLLFRCYSESCCEEIANKKLKPLRTCISRNDRSLQSRTGLSLDASALYVHSGVGESFSKAVDAQKGDVFILVVDNVYKNGKGHQLKIFDCLNEITVKEPEKTVEKIEEPKIETPVLDTISVKKDTITVQKIEEPKSEKDTSMTPEKELDRFEKIINGGKVTLDKVYFYGNSSFAFPKSEEQLKVLLKFMEEDENRKIILHSHTNGTSYNVYSFPKDEKSSIFAKDERMAFTGAFCRFYEGNSERLSQERGESVKNYLVKNGINKKRILVKSWGSKKMLYPEYSKMGHLNRRVEVEVVLN